MYRGLGASILICLVGFALAVPNAHAEVPAQLWTTCEEGSDGACNLPRGVAANPATGHVYVADQSNARVLEFSVWGDLVRAWGWDVVASGPGDSGTGFEICVPADGDICKAAAPGTGAGQFAQVTDPTGPLGLALDSAGAVYAVDFLNRRVQKFDSEGNFLLMFGGDVNKTKVDEGAPEAAQNVCTAASGDVCQAGTEGAGNGQFGAWRIGSFIAVDSGDKVYVGDQNRIQRFDTGGVYQAQIAQPGETVQSLAVDEAGNLYVAYWQNANNSKPDVRKLSPVGIPIAPTTFPVPNPRAIAVDAEENVYVFDRANTEVLQFSSSATLLTKFAEDLSAGQTGIGTNTGACGMEGTAVYVTNTSPSFLRAYSPTPDPALCPPPNRPPLIVEQYAVSVGIGEATVGAAINPRFRSDATYYVEYGLVDCAVGPCERSLFPGVPLTSAVTNEPVAATAELGGLQPDTTYHFRFVAESSGGGPTFGPDETFTTFPPEPAPPACANDDFRIGFAAFLPDCRAYEMVSPLDKNNGDIRAGVNVSNLEQLYAQASLDGGKLTYSSATAFGDTEGAPYASQYIASRDPSTGWATHSITPPRETNIAGGSSDFLSNQFVAFSSDLCTGWLFWDGDPPLGDPPTPGLEGYRNLYRRSNCGTSADGYEALTTRQPSTTLANADTEKGFNPVLQGFSADGTHAVFRANDALPVDEGPAPNPGKAGSGSNRQLYEVYDEGKLRLVSVLPDGTASKQQNTAGLFTSYTIGSATNAVSTDGSRIFWTSALLANQVGTLYVRIDGQETVQVSGTFPAAFSAATPSGSKALFTEAGDLRLFDVATETSTTLAGGVQGVAGASQDLSRVYFVSVQQLDPNPNSEGDLPVGGQPNLYLWEAGKGSTFVATLTGAEGSAGSPPSGVTGLSVSNYALAIRLSRVSPDGQHLAFVSRMPLTGYDNTDVESGEADTEVFRYAAASDVLHCVSCNPSGARPSGSAEGISGRGGSAETVLNAAAVIPGWQGHFHARRVLSADGQRLYFESFDPLLPRDRNDSLDVYQWQSAGKGDCKLTSAHFFAENGGCLALISAGVEDSGDSDFIDATPTGDDVFFRTEDSLVAQDTGLVDIYDARVNGGFPPPPPPPQPCSQADPCPPGTPAPQFPVPASRSTSGPGNLDNSPDCRALGRRAKRLERRAKGTLRAARRAASAERAATLRRRARGLGRKAKRVRANAKRCRIANGRAGG